jgi:hypothetical protein
MTGPDNTTDTCTTFGECLYGCNDGFAGPNCSVKCPKNCATYDRGVDICNATSEECSFGCKDGFYGPNCSERCSDVDGNCEKCIAKHDKK